MTAPALRSLAVIVASRRGTAPSIAIDPAVVGRSSVPTLSLSRTGMPSSGWRTPARRARSRAAATSSACGFSARIALNWS
jgi:hypothetical protein